MCRNDGGIGKRPAPLVPHANQPSSGSTTEELALLQSRQVSLGSRMLPHGGVHGRCEYHLTLEGEVEGAEKIVRRTQANFASRSAVAGTTTRRSFSWATAMCSIALDKVSLELSCEKRSEITLLAR